MSSLEDEDNDFHDAIDNDSDADKSLAKNGVESNNVEVCEGPIFQCKDADLLARLANQGGNSA